MHINSQLWLDLWSTKKIHWIRIFFLVLRHAQKRFVSYMSLNNTNALFLKFFIHCKSSMQRALTAFFLCRRYGTKCGGCSQVISPTDLVRKARGKVFHLNCFTCIICNKQLSTGEELYILDESKFVCKEDYLSNSTGKDANLLSSTRAFVLWTILEYSLNTPCSKLGKTSPYFISHEWNHLT